MLFIIIDGLNYRVLHQVVWTKIIVEMMVIILLILVGIPVIVSLSETQLHQKLFELYNPDVIPIGNGSDHIEVSLELYPLSIDGVDEKSQTFTIRALLEYRWKDEFLTWNPQDYGGKTRISVQNTNIWLPDLALLNVYDNPTDLGQTGGRTSVYHNGMCITRLYKMHQVGCKIRIQRFPFDVQNCELDFLSWNNPNTILMLKTSGSLDTSRFIESSEWDLQGYEVHTFQRSFGEDTWDRILVRFKLRRKWLFVVMNMVAPIVCISLLNLLCFVTPAESGEKLGLSIAIFLTMAVFLTIVSGSLPESSDEISLLGIYVGIQLLGSGLTVVSTVFCLRLFHKEEKEPVSYYYRLLCKAFCCFKASDQYETNEQTTVHKTSKEHFPKTFSFTENVVSWQSAARAFDRMCLLFSVIWNVTLIIGLVCALN